MASFDKRFSLPSVQNSPIFQRSNSLQNVPISTSSQKTKRSSRRKSRRQSRRTSSFCVEEALDADPQVIIRQLQDKIERQKRKMLVFGVVGTFLVLFFASAWIVIVSLKHKQIS